MKYFKPWTVLLVLLLGCTSLTPDRLAVLAAIAGNAAQIGAAAWLKDHPEHVGAFQAIVDALSGLQSVGAGAKAYTENARGRRLTLHDLPTTTLAGSEGAVYLSDGVVRVWDERTQKSYDGSPEPVRKAIVMGLKRALAPVPPVPMLARKRSPYTLELNPGVATNNAYTLASNLVVASKGGWAVWMDGDKPHLVWTNGLPSLPEPAPPQPTTTNVVRSAMSVAYPADSVPQVSVRWLALPDSVYHIEQGDGTNWLRFGCLTNAGPRARTNWATAFPPAVPVGTWRVLRR